MSFEAEVIPLFIGGVIAVSAIEFSWAGGVCGIGRISGAVCRARGCHAAGIFLLDSQSVCQLAGALSGYCLHFQLCEYRPFRPLLGCQRPLRGSDAFPLGGCTKILIIPVCGSGYPVNTCVSCHNARPVRSSCAVLAVLPPYRRGVPLAGKAERAERAAGQMRFCTPDFHRSPVNTQAPSHTGSAVFCTVGRGGAQFCRRRKLRLADLR